MSNKDILKEITIAHLATNGGTAEKELFRLITTGIPVKELDGYKKIDYFDIHTPDDGGSFKYCYDFYKKLSTTAQEYVLLQVKVDVFWYFLVKNIERIYLLNSNKTFRLLSIIEYLHRYYLYNKVYVIVEEIPPYPMTKDEIPVLERTSGRCCYNFTDEAKKFLIERAKNKLKQFCEDNKLTIYFCGGCLGVDFLFWRIFFGNDYIIWLNLFFGRYHII